MAPPSTSASEDADRRRVFPFPPPPHCVPDLDRSSDSLTTQDSDNSFDPTPQSLHIPCHTTAQYSNFSSYPYSIQSLPEMKLWQDVDDIYSPIDQVVSNVTDASPKREDIHDGMFIGPYTTAYEELSSERGIPDFSSMAEPELSYSTTTTESSTVDSSYWAIEQTRSEPLKRREEHRWPCQLCDKSYIRQGNLRLHERKKHKISSETVKNVRQEAGAQDDRMAKSLQSTPGEVSRRETSPLPHSRDLTHYSSKDEVKLMDYQGYDTTDESDKARVSRKRENHDDDASHCSGAFSNEEGDDSDCECDDVTTWNCSQRDAIPSFLPYNRGHDADIFSPCGDSTDSGSTTSGTTSNTPASSISSLNGGNGRQGNGCTLPSGGIGASNNSNSPILGIKDGTGANFAPDPQHLPLICWYSAAGIACTSKYVKMSTEVRYLWNDHAWGKDQGPNHRLSDACQRCKRLFLTQQLLEEHVRDIAPQGPCRVLSSVELEALNRELNRLGVSLECKKAIDGLRTRIKKETKGDKLPALHDSETMALLEQRVDSNVSLYINGSKTNEKTARSELWKWYLIFKKLRPDDEIPINPFISAQRLAGPEERPRADAHRIFMHIFDQRRIEGCLPELDDDQRTALGRVFLDTLEMLGANEANERHRSVQTRNPRKRRKLSAPEDPRLAPAPNNLSLARAIPTLAITPVPIPADLTLTTTTPALAPAPIPVEVPPSVRNPVNFQHPTFTPPEVQNQLLSQIPSSVPQSFMPSTDNLWLLQQQQQPQQQLQQQQEAGDAHLLSPMGDLDYINSWTDYNGLPEFGTRDN